MSDKALLVGINNYPTCPLNGCVDDIDDVYHFLVQQCAFNPKGVAELYNADATTENILRGLRTLAADAQPGDRVLFWYSGHGAQVDTINPAESADGAQDDVICPVDFDWTNEHLIRNEQFHAIFAAMPAGVKLNWVSDSCHSGDLERDFPNPMKHGPYRVARSFPITPRVHEQKWLDPRIQARAIVNGILDVGFIAGCQSDQTSADAYINGRYNGALTYYLLDSLKATPTAPLNQVIVQVRGALANNGYDQVPQVQGARQDKPFLG